MPLVRIDLRKGKDAAYRQHIGRVVHEALLSVGVPENDRFQIIGEHDPGIFYSIRITWASSGAMIW
jgi:4-oxalocrotonate tautomerase